LDQRPQGGLGELTEPVADGAGRRDAGQPAEARDQGIAGDIAEVLEAAGAGVEERQDEQGEPATAVVAAGGRPRRAQPTRQVVLPQVAAQQLQAAVRRQLLVDDSIRNFPLILRRRLATLRRIRPASCVWGVTWGCPLPLRTQQEAVLFHRILDPFHAPVIFGLGLIEVEGRNIAPVLARVDVDPRGVEPPVRKVTSLS
jgi:hypothetical protein